MPTLYHCVSARSFRPLWVLEELGLAYDLVMLPFPPRQRSPDYLGLNRLGTVPLYVDGTLRMTESAAICGFLAARHSPRALALSVEETAYGSYLNWLHFGEATLTFPQTLVLRYGRLEPPERRAPQIVADYTRWFLSRLRGIEAVVSSQEFLCAGRFTAADISVGYALMLADTIGLGAHFSEPVAAYWQRLKARASFAQALAAQERAAMAQGVPTVPSPLVT